MADSRWSEVRRILELALDVEPEERQAFVEQECAGDPELLNEVCRKLALGDSATLRENLDWLEGGLPAEALLEAAGDDLLPGSSIGNYAVIRELGIGGMGRVLEARQENPSRLVALKVMSAGFHGTEHLRRFEQEASFLARLRHPGIAQIYEFSTYEAKGGALRPFFAMEYVEGALTISEYAQRHLDDDKSKIALFGQICRAVHFGHLKGVLHRDLKPGNLLVDQNGNPKVIDFGVARIEESEGEHLTRLTQTGQLVGTLRYMSPEQISGETLDLDFRSDVYALGVILFELLTGRSPYPVDSESIPAIALAISEVPPLRPSQVTPHLKGDLEWILLRALEKEPARRYQSAEALAEDLERHLKNEPVLASPPSRVYLIRKFAARHRSAVFLSLLVVVTASISGALTLRQYLQKRHGTTQRPRASRS